jgi:sortase A
MNDTTEHTGATHADPAPPRPSTGTSRGRLAGWLVGFVLLVTGLALLGYVGWEYYGTDVVSKHEQAKLRAQLREEWRYPTVGDVVGPGAPPILGQPDALIRIPRFGSDYEVPMIEGVRPGDLDSGIGHFPGTGPGQIGNFALAGHRVTHGEPFHDLPELRPGDKVVVETADATYTYVLDTDPNDLSVPFTQTWVTDSVPVPPDGEAPPGMPVTRSKTPTRALLTLTTCSELFHTDSRLVAFGHLVSTDRK